MTVTSGNVKALLGYDPTNKDYIAVQAYLDTKVPSVQVLRVASTRIVCTPSKVIIPASTWVWDEKALCLQASLYVDDELITTQNVVWNESMCLGKHNAAYRFTADQMLLNAIFFYSGMDLYRQQGMLQMKSYSNGASGTSSNIGDGIWLDGGNYVPFLDGNFYFEGFSSDMANSSGEIVSVNSSGETWEKTNIQLKFEYTQNLPTGYTDLVRDLWGANPPTLYSCAKRSISNM
jgi:hypothetical protein